MLSMLIKCRLGDTGMWKSNFFVRCVLFYLHVRTIFDNIVGISIQMNGEDRNFDFCCFLVKFLIKVEGIRDCNYIGFSIIN